jgi:O-acetyl-ADP-ribose deacetylase (regulator of RNase III)
MIRFAEGNLLDAEVDALVNTVNTYGVMGKGIALMFKDAFPENTRAYEAACKRKEVQVGTMFVTERRRLTGPKWIINFPTKKHWRNPSNLAWIEAGLEDLKRVVVENGIRSIALPPLGSGNGGLDWQAVRSVIVKALETLTDVDIVVYEPTAKYQNVAKREGVEKLTPARALIVELVRRYMVLGLECTLLEIQKLAYLLERAIEDRALNNPLNLQFEANRFGPFAPKLTHLLNALDGSYLHCDKRLGDAGPLDIIWFDESKRDRVATYLRSEAKLYQPVLAATSEIIDGFESPLGMELIATVDWLLRNQQTEPRVGAIKDALRQWPGGADAGARKLRHFDDRMIEIAIERLVPSSTEQAGAQ